MTANGTGALILENASVHGGGAVTVDAKSVLRLHNSQMSLGGLLSIAATGVLATYSGNTTGVGTNNVLAGDAIQDGEIEDAGAIFVANDSTLNLNGAVYNSGAIDLFGSTGPTELEVFATGLTIDTARGVALSNSANNKIVSNGTGTVLSVDTKIAGAGVIGDGWLRVVNHLGGAIIANQSTGLTLLADTAAVAAGTEKENYNDGTLENKGSGGMLISGGTFSNAGYLIEDGTGALTLSGAVIDNGGGIVRAVAGSIVLKGNSQITSQSYVTIAAGASIKTTAGDLNDAIYSNVVDGGAIDVVGGSTLGVDGHWSNTSAVNVGDASGGGILDVAAGQFWLLQSSGVVDLANAGDKIISGGAGAILQDKANLIQGGGTVGDANMQVDIMNGAKVDATLATGMTLTAQAQSGSTTYLYNAGVLQSDSAGGLTLNAAIYSPGQMIVNSGDKIVANFAVYGAGTTTINGTGSVEFHAEADNDVYFGATTGGQMILDASHQFFGQIFGLAAGDSIDLRDFAFVSGSTGVDTKTSAFGALDGELFVTNGTTDSAPLYLAGDYTAANLAANHLAFQFTSDGHLISGTSSDGTLVQLVKTA